MLIAGFGLMSASQTTAQTFTTLHSFANNDGFHSEAEVILSATLFMERRVPADLRATALYFPSKPTARILRFCMILPPTAMERFRWAD
ncbi:MAG: hypothetical protein WDM76_17930 [Limisphaerales bacterium]